MFVKGTAYESDFMTKLINHLTTIPSGATEPYWTQVGSGSFATEGVILHSKGTSGTDDIFVQFKRDGTTFKNNIIARVLYNYTPNAIAGIAGTYEAALGSEQLIYWYPSAYPTAYTFNYWLSFDRDRIMLSLNPHKILGSTFSTFAWIGMPQRLSNEPDSTAATILCSRYAFGCTGLASATGLQSRCRFIRNKAKQWNVFATLYTSQIFKTIGWGGHMFLPDIFLDSGEGYRSKVHGVHPIVPGASEEFEDGDEIMIGSVRYTIFRSHITNGNTGDHSCFTTEWLAVEQLQ